MNNLAEDDLQAIFDFVGDGHFASVVSVDRRFRSTYTRYLL